MAAAYPGTVKRFTTKTDFVDVVEASDIDTLQDEVVAIQNVLGINPQGNVTGITSVAGRIAALEAAAIYLAGAQTITGPKVFTGDVTLSRFTVTAPTALATAGRGSAQVGDTNTTNIIADGTGWQARNNGATAPLKLNPLGGQVQIGADGLSVAGAATVTGAMVVGAALTVAAALTAASLAAAGGGTLGALVAGTGAVTIKGPAYFAPPDATPTALPISTWMDPSGNWKYARTNGTFWELVDSNPGVPTQPYLVRVGPGGNVWTPGRIQAANLQSARVTTSGARVTIPNNQWTDFRPPSRNYYRSDYDVAGVVFETNGFIYYVDDGTLFITARMTWVSNNTGVRGIRVITSSGVVVDETVIDASLMRADFIDVNAQWHVTRATSSYAKVQVYQTSGFGLDILGNTDSHPSSISATLMPA